VISRAGLRRASARLTPVYCLALGALFVTDFVINVRAGIFGADFRGTIWQAGRDILHGNSPYPAPNVATLAHAGNPAVYPAATLVAASPLGLLPFTVSAILWDIAAIVALFAALRIINIRDWRIYGVVFLSFPAASSLQLGQLDAFLALGCALVWRWRHRPGARLAIVLATVVLAKVFLWPLLVWTLAIGRRRQSVAAAATAVSVVIAGWAAIGFAGFAGYPRLLSALINAYGSKGYSLMALGTRVGLSSNAARLLPLVALIGLCALCIKFARAGREESSFFVAVAAAILGSPILWLHYVLVLFVALAVVRPRFSAVWFVPVALWLVPTENPSSALDFALGLSLLLLLVGLGAARSLSLSSQAAVLPTAEGGSGAGVPASTTSGQQSHAALV
jgi:alpha-1,2-mannosyltransferase